MIDGPFRNISCANQTSFLVSPFLFPFAIEYSLICGAVVYKILQKVEEHPVEEPPNNVEGQVEEPGRFPVCHRPHKGLFIWLLFFMVIVTALTIVFLLNSKNSVIYYHIIEIILILSSIVSLIFAFIQIRVLKLTKIEWRRSLGQ